MPKKDYSWITQEMFDEKLTDILAEMGSAQFILIPGVYAVVAEWLNNQVLEELEEERERERR